MSVGWDYVSKLWATVYPPDDIYEYEAMVEWYWQGKPKNLGINPSQRHFIHYKSHMD
jgi:hypothetical protein